MKILLYSSIFLFGALWGSFFYTLALRFAAGLIDKDPFHALMSSSRCPSCNEKINKFFLIPIIGFIILRGKCKHCRSNIPVSYPFYETVFGLLLILLTLKYGIDLYSFNIFLLLSVVITIAIIDLKTFTIPDSLLILFVIFSIYPIIMNYSFKDNLYGFVLMFLFFTTVLFIFPGSFGGGDVKFASAIGLLLGLQYSIVALETALITGTISGIIYALGTGKTLKAKIPFGPFLAAGLFVALFYGREIVLIYFKIF